MSTISKNLGSILKWSGKYTFFMFVLSMILTGVLITLADPQATNIYVEEGSSSEYSFSLSSTEDLQMMVASHEGQDMQVTLYKLSFISSNETYNFRQSSNDEVIRTEVLSSTTDVFLEVRELGQGEYILAIASDNEESFTTTFLYSYFNLGQIIATAISWSVFGVIASVFFMVLPFWVVSLILSSVKSSNPPGRSPSYQNSQSKTQKGESSTNISHQSQTSQSTSSPNVPDFIKGTQLEKLTRRDWILLAFGGFFFIGYLSNPLNGFLLFLSAAFLIGVAYGVTEREKSKQRIDILLRSYPTASIAFVAEQLDKEEDYVIDVLRIMILDEGYPIRLDLVNRSITKVGTFSGEAKKAKSHPSSLSDGVDETQETVSDDTSETDASSERSTSDDVQVKHGERGTVEEPWAYCQSCGEALKQKITYCYICGARQQE